jgi:RNA polymerase sigma-70 factor (ECF subfamily)
LADIRFDHVCGKLHAPLLIAAFRLSGDREHARDLVQDTMVRALERWDSFLADPERDPIDHAGAWLHRILFNHFCSQRRHLAFKRKALGHQVEPSVHRDGPAGNGGVHPNVFGVENSPATTPRPDEGDLSPGVWDLLSELGPVTRELILAVDVAGESHEDVAARLNLREGTVKSRLSRARKKLAELLGEDAR